MDATTYRRVMFGSLAALLALVAAVWIINPLGDDAALPDPLARVFPLPGDTVVRQTIIEVDLPVGYTAAFEIDGIAIPSQELDVIAATGRWGWSPGPDRLWEVWTAGEHTVTVRWDRTAGGRPDPGEYSWTFRVA